MTHDADCWCTTIGSQVEENTKLDKRRLQPNRMGASMLGQSTFASFMRASNLNISAGSFATAGPRTVALPVKLGPNYKAS